MSDKNQTQAPQCSTTPSAHPFAQVTQGAEKVIANVTSGAEKVIAEQTARYEAAVAELTKLQTKGLAQAQTFFETATRVGQEQLAFAEQLGGEWRKIALAATSNAGAYFAPKS